ncbi:MAG: 50S ribosomal protein L17 [Deferribacteres bacterium]|nr:50S ribosomal protein L17 [candidate division KSB1 bacterium]MCB9502664.1 50S ribosomal protein L17 [Deferribacteres bacterium]
MRHGKDHKQLGRPASHRRAMLSNLVSSLFEHKQIRTTLVKAKEGRRYAERCITFGKKGTLAARRHVYKFIPHRNIIQILFDEIAPEFADRNGGYTRIIKLGRRKGDGAEIAILELVGYETTQIEKQHKAAEKRAERKKRKEEQAQSEEQETAPKASEAAE